MHRFMVSSTRAAAVAASAGGTPAAASAAVIAWGVIIAMICSPFPGVCHACAAWCHTYSRSSGAPPAAQLRTSVGLSETARTVRSAPQSWPTTSMGPGSRASSPISQST